MLQFPPILEQIILKHLKETFLNPKKKGAGQAFNEKDFLYFARGAEKLSQAFTRERGSLPPNYLTDPVLRSGYLLYFLPVNLLKIVAVLNQLGQRTLFKTPGPVGPRRVAEGGGPPPRADVLSTAGGDEDSLPAEALAKVGTRQTVIERGFEKGSGSLLSGKIRVLDVGSGPGTSMLGIMSFYEEAVRQKWVPEAWLDFTLVDQGYSVLRDARLLHEAYRSHLGQNNPHFQSTCSVRNFDIRRGEFSRFLRNYKYHLIILCNFLNEVRSFEERCDMVSELVDRHLEPKNGRLIIIEPALRKTSRDLQALRDEIVVNRKLAKILSPCVHQGECPLNRANERDWCHFYLSWKLPRFVDRVGQLIGTNKEWLALSYLVLRKINPFLPLCKGEPEGVERRGPEVWRVISNLMPTNGKKEVVLCGEAGRTHLEKLDKIKGEKTASFNALRRGDLVRVAVPGAKDYRLDGKHRVGEGEAIEILSHF